jgi:hypothetical protein
VASGARRRDLQERDEYIEHDLLCTSVGDAHDSVVGERSEACGDRFWRRLRRTAAIFLIAASMFVVSIYVLLYGVGFVVATIFLVRPVLIYMARLSPARTRTRAGVIRLRDSWHHARRWLCHGLTDAMGIDALFLHLYIMSSGLKTNVATMAKSWGFLVLPFTTACWQDR